MDALPTRVAAPAFGGRTRMQQPAHAAFQRAGAGSRQRAECARARQKGEDPRGAVRNAQVANSPGRVLPLQAAHQEWWRGPGNTLLRSLTERHEAIDDPLENAAGEASRKPLDGVDPESHQT